jgi:hypothetical protein
MIRRHLHLVVASLARLDYIVILAAVKFLAGGHHVSEVVVHHVYKNNRIRQKRQALLIHNTSFLKRGDFSGVKLCEYTKL